MGRWVAGVDGCKAAGCATGWIVALRDLDSPGRIRIRVVSDFVRAVECDEAPIAIGVDMPIGLPDELSRSGRKAEQLVRALLGRRRNSVFPTSVRSVVYTKDYTSAIALARSGLQPFAPSPVANALFPRIRQIDSLLRERPALRERVYEVHPELAFWTMNGQRPVTDSKRTRAGIEARRSLLRAHGIPGSATDADPPRGAKIDDLLDALAALVVAERIAMGQGKSYPDPPERDRHGLPAAIWSFDPSSIQVPNSIRISGERALTSATTSSERLKTVPNITRADIEAAHSRIAPHIRRTPSWTLPGAFGHGGPISLKLEFLQHAGSFKTRGAFNTLLSKAIPPAGVAAASGGNHGAAVAYAAKQLGLKARIFVPEISSPAKVAVIRSHGAEVAIGGARYADAQAACDLHVAETGALRIHPFDADATIIGQGTVGLEWEQDSPPLDTVLVAVGGGGLISGISTWFAGRVKVVGVEPEGSRALHAALQAGRPVDVEVHSVAADSLGARSVGDLVHSICRDTVDHVALVTDEAIIDAQGQLWRDWRIATEPGGAAALAALTSGAYKPKPDERIGVLLCGANVDPSKL
jgi:threonine dehydratase